MATLPKARFARIPQQKITDYLLEGGHPAGRAKARFFLQFGFNTSDRQVLGDALLGHARSAPVVLVTETLFGTKYLVEGSLIAPDGRTPQVRAVWFIARGETVPRLVTAYPLLGVE